MQQKYEFAITGVCDMNLAAFLMYCGFELVDIVLPEQQEKEQYKKKFGFIFRASELIKPKMQEYFEGNSLVDPLRLFKIRKLLKQKITEKQAEVQQ